MFKSENEIKKFLLDYCNKYKENVDDFELSPISNASGGQSNRHQNRSVVKNINCKYVIKYYSFHNLFVIWKYSPDRAMDIDFNKVKKKLSVGERKYDKGKIKHFDNQVFIYFDYSENLEALLNMVYGRLS